VVVLVVVLDIIGVIICFGVKRQMLVKTGESVLQSGGVQLGDECGLAGVGVGV